jgi:hypothetical protein
LASPTGVIIGSIKDQSGAAISGAQITLVRTDTNTRLTAKTDANGAYQFPQLAPANYALTVEASGFKKVTVGTVVVQVDQITRVDLALEVGAVTELVEVQGATPILETDKNTLSSVVDSRTISNMPLNARQFLDLAVLTPGVLPAATGTQGGGFNVAGARSQSNVFLVDGVSNTDTQINSPLNNFRITDAVQEFAVQTSVSQAEFGRGSGCPAWSTVRKTLSMPASRRSIWLTDSRASALPTTFRKGALPRPGRFSTTSLTSRRSAGLHIRGDRDSTSGAKTRGAT